MAESIPLPSPYKIWTDNRAIINRGALTVIAGGPGSGKTITALNLVDKINVPTMYFSNDSTQYTIVTRGYSMLAQKDISETEELVKKNPVFVAEVLNRWSHVRWDFNSSPDLEEIFKHGDAFRELYGEYPPMTVVDIIMNVDQGESSSANDQKYWGLFKELKIMAADWNTGLVAVHHTSEQAKGNPCPPRSAIMGKANQLPELIITQNIIGDKVAYAVVKNRNGPSDETGETHWTQPIFASQFRIEEAAPPVPLIFRDGPKVPESQKINPEKQEDWEL